MSSKLDDIISKRRTVTSKQDHQNKVIIELLDSVVTDLEHILVRLDQIEARIDE